MAHRRTDSITEASDSRSELERARERLALMETKAKIRSYELIENRQKKAKRLMESGEDSWSWVGGGYSDAIDRFGTGRDWTFPFSTANDRRYGANWPFWRTWAEHSRLRAASRLIWYLSPMAMGAIGALTSYIIGKGHQAKIVGKKDDVDEVIIDAVQFVVDEFADQANWLSMQQEIFMRDRRDGESFVRKFPQDDGMTILRIVEPECVVEPPNYRIEEASYGLITDPDDLFDIRAFFFAYDGNPSTGEEIPHYEVIHSKSFWDGAIKRGLPDFAFDTQVLMKTVGRLLESMGQGAAIRSAIAFVRQHSVAPQAATADFIETTSDYSEQRPFTGRSQDVMRFEPGTVIDMDKGQEFVPPPGSDNVGADVQVVQALLRAVAVRWNAPEWITSSDSSNNSFASSLTAEAPFVKTGERWQAHYSRTFRQTVLDAIQHFCRRRGGIRIKGQKYSWEVLRRIVDVSVVPPTMESRDKAQDAQRNKTLVDMGVKSRQTVAQEEGLKFKTEERNNDEWEKKHGKGEAGGGTGAGGMPGIGGGGLPGGGPPPEGPGGGGGQPPQPGQPQQEDTASLEAFLDSLGGGGGEQQAVTESSLMEACVPNATGHGHHNDDTGWPCSPNPEHGGFFSPDGPKEAGTPAPAAQKKALAALIEKAGGIAAGAKLAAQRVGEVAWSKMTPFQRKGASMAFAAVKGLFDATMLPFRRATDLVEEAIRERGLPVEHAERVAKIIAITDQVVARISGPVAAAATGNPALAMAVKSLPVCAIGYLIYSTGANPLATLRAAKSMLARKMKPLREAEEAAPGMADQDDIEALITLLHGARDPDLAMAAVLVALDQTGNLKEAITLAASAMDGEHLTESVQRFLMEGRGVNAKGHTYCWDDKSGHRVKCHEDPLHSNDKDVQAAHAHVDRLVSAPRGEHDIKQIISQLSVLTKEEIKQLQKKHGLHVGGKKEELIRRVVKAAAKTLDVRHEYEREARKAGIPPAEVTKLAREHHTLAVGYVKAARNVVASARKAYRSFEGKNLSRNIKGFRDGDPSHVPHLDVLAADMAGQREYAGIFQYGNDDADHSRVLYDLLLTGGPPMPKREDAFKAALDTLKRRKQEAMDEVPFDVGGGEAGDEADMQDAGEGSEATGSNTGSGGVGVEEPEALTAVEPVIPTAKEIQQKTHKLSDVVDGKHPVGVEGRGGKDWDEAKRLGMYTNMVNGVKLFAKTAEDASSLETYLRDGGRYGTLEFSRLLGYSPEEIKEYKRYLVASGQPDLAEPSREATPETPAEIAADETAGDTPEKEVNPPIKVDNGYPSGNTSPESTGEPKMSKLNTHHKKAIETLRTGGGSATVPYLGSSHKHKVMDQLRAMGLVEKDRDTYTLTAAGREAAGMPETSLPDVPPADAAPQPDGTRKGKDGTVWAKAPAGGEDSPVNGKHYKGGQWMPIHGLSEPRKPTGKGTGTGDAPTPPKSEEGKEKTRRSVMTPEEIENLKAEREREQNIRAIKRSVLNRFMVFGDDDRYLGKSYSDQNGGIVAKDWAKFAETLGEDGLRQFIDTYKPKLAEKDSGWNSPNGIEQYKWLVDNEKKYMTAKHKKAAPSSAEARVIIDSLMREKETTFDDILGMANTLQGLHDKTTGADHPDMKRFEGEAKTKGFYSNRFPGTTANGKRVKAAEGFVQKNEQGKFETFTADQVREKILFTGTDSLGREWVNGELVAAKENPASEPVKATETPAATGAGTSSPDVTNSEVQAIIDSGHHTHYQSDRAPIHLAAMHEAAKLPQGELLREIDKLKWTQNRRKFKDSNPDHRDAEARWHGLVDVYNTRLDVARKAAKEDRRVERKQSDVATLKQQQEWERSGSMPDGRQMAKLGDRVFIARPGVFGLPTTIQGEVYRATSGKLMVRVVGGGDMIGMANVGVGKKYDWTPEWSVKGDPELDRRKKAVEDQEAVNRQKEEKSKQATLSAEDSSIERSLAAGEARLNPSTVKPGDIVTTHWDGTARQMIVTEVSDTGDVFATEKENPDQVGGYVGKPDRVTMMTKKSSATPPSSSIPDVPTLASQIAAYHNRPVRPEDEQTARLWQTPGYDGGKDRVWQAVMGNL